MDKLKTILKTTSIYGWLDLFIPIFFIIVTDNLIFRILFLLLSVPPLIRIIKNKHYHKSEFNVPKEYRKPYVQYDIDSGKLLLLWTVCLFIILLVSKILLLSFLFTNIIILLLFIAFVITSHSLVKKKCKLEEIIENQENTL